LVDVGKISQGHLNAMPILELGKDF